MIEYSVLLMVPDYLGLWIELSHSKIDWIIGIIILIVDVWIELSHSNIDRIISIVEIPHNGSIMGQAQLK